jgi:hypothetical protein
VSEKMLFDFASPVLKFEKVKHFLATWSDQRL